MNNKIITLKLGASKGIVIFSMILFLIGTTTATYGYYYGAPSLPFGLSVTPPIQPTVTQNTVVSSSTSYALKSHSTLFVNGNYWVFFQTGSYFRAMSSPNGATWSSQYLLLTTGGLTPSMWFDKVNSRVLLSYATAGNTYYESVTLNAAGTVSLGSLVTVATPIVSVSSIITDSSGNVWLAGGSGVISQVVLVYELVGGNFVQSLNISISGGQQIAVTMVPYSDGGIGLIYSGGVNYPNGIIDYSGGTWNPVASRLGIALPRNCNSVTVDAVAIGTTFYGICSVQSSGAGYYVFNHTESATAQPVMTSGGGLTAFGISTDTSANLVIVAANSTGVYQSLDTVGSGWSVKTLLVSSPSVYALNSAISYYTQNGQYQVLYESSATTFSLVSLLVILGTSNVITLQANGPTTIPPGGTVSFTATVKNTLGNPVANDNVTLCQSGCGQGGIASGLTNTLGIVTFNPVFNTLGPHGVYAIDSSGGLSLTITATVSSTSTTTSTVTSSTGQVTVTQTIIVPSPTTVTQTQTITAPTTVTTVSTYTSPTTVTILGTSTVTITSAPTTITHTVTLNQPTTITQTLTQTITAPTTIFSTVVSSIIQTSIVYTTFTTVSNGNGNLSYLVYIGSTLDIIAIALFLLTLMKKV